MSLVRWHGLGSERRSEVVNRYAYGLADHDQSVLNPHDVHGLRHVHDSLIDVLHNGERRLLPPFNSARVSTPLRTCSMNEDGGPILV
jgi:hypothetical protein